jgi:hypothetical protein
MKLLNNVYKYDIFVGGVNSATIAEGFVQNTFMRRLSK